MAKKKSDLSPLVQPAPIRKERDTRSLLERAAQDDPVLSVHFYLGEDQLLACRSCDFVTAQPNNAKRHLEARHPAEDLGSESETEKPPDA